MNELKRHQKSDKIKWVCTGVAFVLLFVFLVGLCMQLFAKDDKYKPSEWFKKPDTEQNQPDIEEKENPETAALSLAVSRYAVKTMSATVDNENGIQPYAETAATSNVEDYSGSYMNFISDLGGGIYRVHGRTFSNPQNAYGVNSFVATDGTTEKEHSSNSSFKMSCVLYYSNSNVGLNEPYGKAVLRFSACTPSDFGFPSNSVLQEIQLMFQEGSLSSPTYRTITPKIYKCNNGYITDIYDGTVVSIVKFVYRVPASLPVDPVKEGHTFVGWYYDSDFNTPYAGEPIYSDTQLYAKFEINKYTVTFNSDGGTEIESQSVNWNTAATLATPTRTGYIFKGWYLPNGTQYTNQAIKENTTLTAHWEVIMCTVTFYVDGEIYDTKTVEYGTPLITVIETANELNLCVMSVRSSNGSIGTSEFSNMAVTDDSLELVSEELKGTDKVVATIKTNKWQIIGGVAGGVALIAVIAALCGGVKRKKR